MSNTALDRATLLTKLRDKVWGDEVVFKQQLNWTDPGPEHSHTAEYLDFGEHLTAIQVIAPTVFEPQFLVREEYRHAIETFEQDDVYNKGACIMGQPGIGKSCFIAYVVIERLRKKLSVAVQILAESYSESYALFSEDGVSLYPGYAQEPLRLHKGIWTFSDSNADVIIPAVAFRTTPDVHVFQTTSPKISRWKEWTKQYRITHYIMNVWSNEEIAALAILLRLDVSRMKDLASKWGPAPRTLLQHFRDDQELLLESTLRKAAFEAIPNCRNILHSVGSLDVPVDPGPSSIFFIIPRQSQGVLSRVLHTIYIPTPTIFEILAEAVCSAAEGQRRDFFNAMIALPDTRGAAGFIFEIWIHSFLARGNSIQCNWLGKAKKLPPTLCLANQKTVSTKNELRHTTPPFYWRAPPSPSFPGIDGALVDEQDVYAIQITISPSHEDPQPGLDKLRRAFGEERAKKQRWRVLFIGNNPEQSEAVSRKYFDKQQKDTSGDGLKQILKKSKPVSIGWCVTSPLNAGISVLKTLANDEPFESDEE